MGAIIAGAALALAILYGGRAEELVVLVPAADGHIGTVVIERDGKKTILNTAYASSHAKGKEELPSGPVPVEEVRRDFGAALDTIPARPATFTLYFLTGTDELTEQSKLEVQRVLDELRRRPAPDIQVIGHTDTVGSDAENDALSLLRAQAMREAMLGLGIPPARIRASGRGKREPLVRTPEGIDEPLNRRVEISVR
ncbi:MAG TPA: OmpA family protein [Burkholderiales bacterium]|jgi:OmpA-OmpF porin, OOP family|nr:OmpA family protein [Burkholderiales bacterium]